MLTFAKKRRYSGSCQQLLHERRRVRQGLRLLVLQLSPSYFFGGELTDFPEAEARLLAAARRETLHRLAVTLLGLSEESLNAVLGSSASASRDSRCSIPVCRIYPVGH